MQPYSYRDDPNVPPFDDSRILLVFDAECVLCSRSMRLLVGMDPARRFRLTPAQGALGQALYRHLGLPADRFETYLVVADARISGESDALIAMARALPWPARAGAAIQFLPRAVRDAAYLLVARHRYRLFGRTHYCGLLTPEMRDRLM